MAMTTVQEFFSGGIVTARDESLLQPGELQRADECVYRMKDPSIQSAPGRTSYGQPTGGAATIKGLAHLTFDGQRDDRLISYVATGLYHSAFTAITGTWSPLTGPGAVDTCVIAVDGVTVTKVGAFTNMIAGTRVIGTGVPVSAVVQTVTSADVIVLSIASTPGTVTLTFVSGIAMVLEDQGTETLDAVQFDNVYYLLTGGTKVRRVGYQAMGAGKPEAFVGRYAGMKPVTVFGDGTGSNSGPSIVAGSWSATLGNGYFYFLITEAINATKASSDVEGTYLANDGKPQVAHVTDYLTQAIQIRFPSAANTAVNGLNQATHWCVYMSDKQVDTLLTPSLATFKLVAVVDITATTALLTDSNLQQRGKPTATAAVGAETQFGNTAGMLTQDDGVWAVSKSGPSTNGSEPSLSKNKATTFGFSVTAPYAASTVRGVKIYVEGECNFSGNAGRTAGFTVTAKTTTKSSVVQFGQFTTENAAIITFGSDTDTLGVSWVPADFANAEFYIEIAKTDSSPARERIRVDGIVVDVFYGGTTINRDGRSFPVVTYRSQVGTTVSDPANLPPPQSTTGDVFQGHFVLNDIGDENAVVYSLPAKGEYFPKPYRMKLKSRKKDKVTFIRTLHQVLVVGLRDTIKRVNYLPTEVDTDFEQGIAVEDLATDHGIAGPLAGVLCDLAGQGVMLVYASYNGVFMTDGITTRPLTQDLAWSALVNLDNLSTCVFRVYPKEKWLVLYYNPAGASHTQNSRAMIFCYDTTFIKEGGFLTSVGPITVSGRSACEANLNGTPYFLTGHQTDGKVYVEDQGTALPVGYTSANAAGTQTAVVNCPLIRTRLLFAGGLSRPAREERVYIRSSIKGSTITATGTTTSGSTTATSAAAFGSVVKGMRVLGTGIKPGTVVTVAGASSITLSQAAIGDGSQTLSFDTGTITVIIRGEEVGDAATSERDRSYLSSANSRELVCHLDNALTAIELQIEKVRMPDQTQVDLGIGLRLHYFEYLIADGGAELNRASN